MTNRVRQLLADGRVHVLDGAMGTMLYGKGVFVNVCYDELNKTQPDLVSEVHRAYIDAKSPKVKGFPRVPIAAFGGMEWPEFIWLDA